MSTLCIYEVFTMKKKKTPTKKPSANVKESYPHFRKYKPSNHPALITGEYSEEEYRYRKVTHSEKDGRHLNEKVESNPNPKDKKPMYIAKRERHDGKEKFSKWKYPWKYKKKK